MYAPPGYDRARAYPVLYLLGGSGELPHNWIYDGRANFILDNLLAEGRAVPMLIAIPNNQLLHRNHPRHVELTFDLFERELREHVVPLVDAAYSTIRSPHGRALSGLSMGGRHAMFVGFRSLDLFASFGGGMAARMIQPAERLLITQTDDSRLILAELRAVVPSLTVAASNPELLPEVINDLTRLIEVITRTS